MNDVIAIAAIDSATVALLKKEAKNRQELKEFLASERVQIFSIDYGTAEHYASVYRRL